eukprot:3459458-Amphidinium_carterae.1
MEQFPMALRMSYASTTFLCMPCHTMNQIQQNLKCSITRGANAINMENPLSEPEQTQLRGHRPEI